MPSQLELYLADLQRFGIRPGLERIRALLQAAGDPQHAYPLVLVGGTNGKGSTSEFLARRLSAHGPVGLYTSPHLYRWNERIRILDAPVGGPWDGSISDSELDGLSQDALPLIEQVARTHHQPTEFEILTFLGLWHFARAGVAAAVIEVGLGGTWDATNVTEPLVSVVTHVALDHCDRLGQTREEIARDKAGIARPGRAFVTAETRPEVLHVFRAHCDSINARLIQVDFAKEGDAGTLPGNPVPSWQRLNARTAAVAAREFEAALGWPAGEKASAGEEASAGAAHSLSIPGRAEILRTRPTVILDGANNPDGAARLAEHLRTAFPGRSFAFVAGFSADKDWQSMLDCWRPLANRWILTQATHPRAAPATELAASLEEDAEAVHIEAIASVPEAVQLAMEESEEDGIIVIAGSFFVLAEVDRSFVAAR